MLNSPECCTREEILRDVHNFVSELGISETGFGRQAVGDPSMIARLRAGKDITTNKLDRIRAYMAAERARRALPRRRLWAWLRGLRARLGHIQDEGNRR